MSIAAKLYSHRLHPHTHTDSTKIQHYTLLHTSNTSPINQSPTPQDIQNPGHKYIQHTAHMKSHKSVTQSNTYTLRQEHTAHMKTHKSVTQSNTYTLRQEHTAHMKTHKSVTQSNTEAGTLRT